MATNGDQSDVAKMMDKIKQSPSSYKVLTVEEYNKLISSIVRPSVSPIASTPKLNTTFPTSFQRMPWSNPRLRFPVPPTSTSFTVPVSGPVTGPMAPASTSASFTGSGMPQPTGAAVSHDSSLCRGECSHNRPNLPNFSGDTPPVKGDTTFEVWSFEVRCLLKDNISESIILQAIRRSLSGTARQMLVPLGDSASVSDILTKLNVLFGNVASNQSLLQSFYTETQRNGESVVAWGCRLEGILQQAITAGHIDITAKNEMLRSKFWTGLASDKLKNATRHKYDSIKSFDLLLKEIRAVDQELNVANSCVEVKSKASTAQQQVILSDSSEMSVLSSQMAELMEKMKAMEERMEKLSNDRNTNTFSSSSGQESGNYRGGRRPYGNRRGNRGSYRGNQAGRGYQGNTNNQHGTDNQPKG